MNCTLCNLAGYAVVESLLCTCYAGRKAGAIQPLLNRQFSVSTQVTKCLASMTNATRCLQVALRFVSQSGVPIAVSPGLNKEYAVEDLELGGFELTAAEMATLAAIKGPHRAH